MEIDDASNTLIHVLESWRLHSITSECLFIKRNNGWHAQNQRIRRCFVIHLRVTFSHEAHTGRPSSPT